MKRYSFQILTVIWLATAMLLSGCSRADAPASTEEAQSYWGYGNMAASEKGYYICQYDVMGTEGEFYGPDGTIVPFVAGFQVFFYDIATQNMVPLCNRADCMHNDIDCNSFFLNDSYIQQINHYDGKVYMVSMDEEYCYLEAMDEAGDNRKRVGELALVNQFSQSASIYFHKGYVYYKKYGEDIAGIYRRQLKGGSLSKEECVMLLKEGSMEDMFFIGDDLYGNLQVTKISEEAGGSPERQNICIRVSLNTFDVEELVTLDKDVRRIAFTEECMIFYYASDEGLWKYDISQETAALVYEEKGCTYRNVCYDGTYVYVENSLSAIYGMLEFDGLSEPSDICFQVFDKSGNYMTQIAVKTDKKKYTSMSGMLVTFYGDSRNMFAYSNNSGELLVFDKDRINAEDAVWTVFDVSRNGFDYSKDRVWKNQR